MQVIISHINLDFDGLASMIAANKLYPKAKIVLPTKQGKSVERFLAIYRDSISFYHPSQIEWKMVTKVIMVDIASLLRIGEIKQFLQTKEIEYTIYDHHQPNEHNVKAKQSTIEQVGATVTLLIEELIAKQLSLTSFESTILALGLYTDTGSFTYLNTTSRDLKAGGYLLENGANLQIVSKFAEPPLQEEEQKLLNCLVQQSEEFYFEGVDILLAYHQQKEYTGGLALLARKTLEMTGSDALIFVVEMGKRIFIVGRSTSERIDVLPIIKQFDGGGHQKAASAMVKNGDFSKVLQKVKAMIYETVQPSTIAKDIMSSPVKVISTATTINDAAKMMLRYGHTGFPVLENNQLVGIISRRDVDKAKHHGLGHAPVKGYMSTDPITIYSTMSLEEIQNLMIDKNVGRLPVVDNKELIGIISRTNVIEALHGEKFKKYQASFHQNPLEITMVSRLHSLLPKDVLDLLKNIAKEADKIQYRAFLIGGIVRDLVMERKNEDIDVVVEGDGIKFASILAKEFGGDVRGHLKFGTATWKHLTGLKIDITSARTEYYDYPAALPSVEMSSLKEDLFRRDFTINAMAIQLNNDHFGTLIDFFHGHEDIQNKKIKVLYNLSFVEDPTRILRAVRFEQRFNFNMDKHTLELALNSVDKIASTSKPRLAHEFQILLQEKHPIEALRRLHEIGVSYYLIGPSDFQETQFSLFKQLFELLHADLIIKEHGQSWICYLIILYSNLEHGLEKVKEFALNNQQLKIINEVTSLRQEDCSLLEKTNDILHLTFKHYRIESIICYLAVIEASPSLIERLLSYLQKKHHMPKLVEGSDLQALAIKPGPIYTEILNLIECAYLKEEISTKEEALSIIHQTFLKSNEM